MARPGREAHDPFDFGQLIQRYFEAHPEKQARNDAMNRAQRTEALWLTPSDIPDLVEWARALQYLSREQGQRLMTTARRMENRYHNAER
jgi:hypothetical protein